MNKSCALPPKTAPDAHEAVRRCNVLRLRKPLNLSSEVRQIRFLEPGLRCRAAAVVGIVGSTDSASVDALADLGEIGQVLSHSAAGLSYHHRHRFR